jgi:hypothetical protein
LRTHLNALGALPSWNISTTGAFASHLCMLCAVLLGAEIALSIAHILWLQVVTFHPLPHLDEWRTAILFSKLEQDSSVWPLLLAPHAEHRPFVPRLVFLLDARLARETGALSLAAIDCLLLGIIAIWFFILRQTAKRNERVTLAAPSVLVLCVVSLAITGHQMSNFVRGFQATTFMVYFFAMLAFAAFASAFQPVGSRRAGRSYLLLFVSCVFAVCAAFSMGNGLLVLPILFMMACARRRELPAGTLLIGAVVVAMTITAYLAGPGNLFGILARTDYKLNVASVTELATFFIRILGGPWATIAPDTVTIIGLLTLLVSTHAIIKYLRCGRLIRYELLSAGLIALTLGSAAAASLARLRFGIDAATESRYSTTVLMLYVALLVSFWPRVHRDAKSTDGPGLNTRQTVAVALFAILIVIYGIASHWKLPYDYAAWADAKADAEVAYVANVQDPLPFEPVVPQPQLDLAWQPREYLRRHNLSVFSTTAARSIGRRLTDFAASPADRCIGHLDAIERVAPGINGGFRVSGWAWDSNDGSVPRSVLLVADGLVQGIGRFIVARPDVVAALPGVAMKSGFVGYVPRGTTELKAYVLDRDQISACRIPGDLALPSG